MPPMFAALGRFCARRRWFVLVAWLVFSVVGAGIGSLVLDRLDQAGRAPDHFESVQAYELISKYSTTGARLIGIVDGKAITDPGVSRTASRAVEDLRQIKGVREVTSPWNRELPFLTSEDGKAGIIAVDLYKNLPKREFDTALAEIEKRLRQIGPQAGVTVRVGGNTITNREINRQQADDLVIGEVIALPLALIVMIVVFGGFLAAGSRSSAPWSRSPAPCWRFSGSRTSWTSTRTSSRSRP